MHPCLKLADYDARAARETAKLSSSNRPESDRKEAPMEKLYYIGLDLHKKTSRTASRRLAGSSLPRDCGSLPMT